MGSDNFLVLLEVYRGFYPRTPVPPRLPRLDHELDQFFRGLVVGLVVGLVDFFLVIPSERGKYMIYYTTY